MLQQRTHFLQVEAVNIYATLFDTGQLSVIRGGSFLLALAMSEIPVRFRDDLERLSSGASVGLYRIKGQADPATIEGRVVDWLRDDPRFGLFTFVVARCAAAELQTAKAVLAAKVRREQLRQLTGVPDRVAGDAARQPCALTGKRSCVPGQDPPRQLGDQRCSLSTSVAQRWKQGEQLKTGLYLQTLAAATTITPQRLERIAGVGYAPDFERLADSPSFRCLNHKMAVIYLDGNGFGAIQRRHVKTPADQIAFDDRIQGYRAEFLATLLEALIDRRVAQVPLLETHCTPEQNPGLALRLETLLWGGDEMTLVVPAWLGFDVLQLFYHFAANWRFKEPLTHAGGIVFCHAHTPIARMRQLAQTLADDVKAWMQASHSQGNFFDYMVLESIDYPVEASLEPFWAHRYGGVAARRTPLRAPADWFGAGRAAAGRLLGGTGLGRGQVFRLARRIAGTPPDGIDFDLFGGVVGALPGGTPWPEAPDRDPATRSAFERMEQRLLALAQEQRPAADPGAAVQPLPTVIEDLQYLAEELGIRTDDPADRAWLWLHLTELWDYLVPERDWRAAAASEAAP